MADLIYRKQALKALEKMKPTVWTESDYELGQKNQWAADEIAIETVPTAQEWIPTSERLPEQHKEVLVTGVSAISGKKVYSVKVWDVDRWRPESAPSIRWDAWMPLPEQFRGGA